MSLGWRNTGENWGAVALASLPGWMSGKFHVKTFPKKVWWLCQSWPSWGPATPNPPWALQLVIAFKLRATRHRKTGASSCNKVEFSTAGGLGHRETWEEARIQTQRIDCVAAKRDSRLGGRGRRSHRNLSQLRPHLAVPRLLLSTPSVPGGPIVLSPHLTVTLTWEHNPFHFSKIVSLFPLITKHFTELGSILFSCLLYSSLLGRFKGFSPLLAWLYPHAVKDLLHQLLTKPSCHRGMGQNWPLGEIFPLVHYPNNLQSGIWEKPQASSH